MKVLFKGHTEQEIYVGTCDRCKTKICVTENEVDANSMHGWSNRYFPCPTCSDILKHKRGIDKYPIYVSRTKREKVFQLIPQLKSLYAHCAYCQSPFKDITQFSCTQCGAPNQNLK